MKPGVGMHGYMNPGGVYYIVYYPRKSLLKESKVRLGLTLANHFHILHLTTHPALADAFTEPISSRARQLSQP